MANVLSFRALSDFARRFIGREGLTFGGKRDLYEALGYPRTLTVGDYRERWRRGGIAGRIVDAYPFATWRGGAELVEVDDPDVSTQFEEDWKLFEKRLNVWSVLRRLDVLAGLGRYAVLVVGLPGKTNEPASRVSNLDGVLYLAPYGEDEAKIVAYDESTESARFGLPTMYRISRKAESGKQVTFDVHWTRTLHVADGMLDDRVFGTPRLERVWNDLDDLKKLTGGGSEAFWQRAHQGFFFNFDPEVDVEDSELVQIREKAEEFANGLRRTLALKGADVKALGSDVANFSLQVASVLSLIAGATGIPQRILLGSERGELASTQDKENWNTRIKERRKDFAEPQVVRPLVQLFGEIGAISVPEDYEIRWETMDDLAPTEQADVADKLAGLNTKAGGLVILPEEIRDRVLRMDPLPEDVVEEWESGEDEVDDDELPEDTPDEPGDEDEDEDEDA